MDIDTGYRIQANRESLLKSVLNTDTDLDDQDLLIALEKLTGWYWSKDRDGEVYLHKTLSELHRHIETIVENLTNCKCLTPIAAEFDDYYIFSPDTYDLITDEFPILETFTPPEGTPRTWELIFMDNRQQICSELAKLNLDFVAMCSPFAQIERSVAPEIVTELIDHFYQMDTLPPASLTNVYNTGITHDEPNPGNYFKIFVLVTEYLHKNKARWLALFEELYRLNSPILELFC